MNDIGINLDDLNADHKRLFDILKRVREMSKKECDPVMLGATLAELNEYASFHFRREIAMMKACNYPDTAIHNQAHTKLENSLDQLLSHQTIDGDGDLCTTLLEFLEDWLIGHIMVMDKAFSQWVGENDASTT